MTNKLTCENLYPLTKHMSEGMCKTKSERRVAGSDYFSKVACLIFSKSSLVPGLFVIVNLVVR